MSCWRVRRGLGPCGGADNVPTQTLFPEADAEETDAEISVPRPRSARPAKPLRNMPGIAEPVAPGASALERWVVLDTLRAEVEAYQGGKLPPDDLFRLTRGSLYVFTNAELVRIAKGMLLLLEATDERNGTGGTGGADEAGPDDVLPHPDDGSIGGE